KNNWRNCAMALATLSRQVAQLREQVRQLTATDDCPSLELVTREGRILDEWLHRQGLTAARALERGLTGPPGRRRLTLQVVTEAAGGVQRWREQRFGAEEIGTEEEMRQDHCTLARRKSRGRRSQVWLREMRRRHTARGPDTRRSTRRLLRRPGSRGA